MTEDPHSAVTIRPLSNHSELDAAVEMQRHVWNYSDLEIESRAMLTMASRFAGQMLGAFRSIHGSEQLIGFSLAFASLPFGHLHSHRVGVHPQYQNSGIGRRLKLAQRADALARGIDQIQWTFDPMQPRNAWFNLVRLGAIARSYLPNLYGITSSPLHGGLPTDRLLAEWNLNSDRVLRALAGERLPHGPDTRAIRLPAPALRADTDAQTALREEFLFHFSQGYTASGLREDDETHTYILERL